MVAAACNLPAKQASPAAGDGAEAKVVTSVEPWFVKECKLVDAIASLTEPGPAGFWIVFDGQAMNTQRGGAVVMWHGRVLATIAGAERVAFAP